MWPAVLPPSVRSVATRALALVFPEDCRICSEPLREFSRIPVCSSCLAVPAPFSAEFHCQICRTPFLTPHPLDEQGQCGLCRRGLTSFDAVYSYGEYSGTLQKLVHLFKYDKIETLAVPFGELLTLALPRDEQFDAVVPVPLHWRRQWSRGFNQADLLARQIGRRRGVPVRRALKRRKFTSTQTGLTGAQRRANMASAFVLRQPEQVAGKRILLIDDVYTTGATSRACAHVLQKAGAKRVVILTLARVDRRETEPKRWLPGEKQDNAEVT